MIIGIEGGIGTGKTLTLVHYGLKDLFAGKKIYSNVKFKNLTRKERSRIFYLDKDILTNMFEEIKKGTIDLTNSTILIQEAHNYVDSRASMTIKNRAFSYWILQSRHTGKGSCDIIFDTQSFDQVDKRLRRNTDFFIHPQISARVGGLPARIALTGMARVGHKWQLFNDEIFVLKDIERYDTHEIVMF